eukprot:COSAG01_NODE_55500_length_324_cov_1.568889_1_plen_54_part_10
MLLRRLDAPVLVAGELLSLPYGQIDYQPAACLSVAGELTTVPNGAVIIHNQFVE